MSTRKVIRLGSQSLVQTFDSNRMGLRNIGRSAVKAGIGERQGLLGKSKERKHHDL